MKRIIQYYLIDDTNDHKYFNVFGLEFSHEMISKWMGLALLALFAFNLVSMLLSNIDTETALLHILFAFVIWCGKERME